ncbi:hypothetical protein [Lysobacter sp. CA199]|uniref:hypothetical protein n=1 Tax=Lysobacter sp. CA199 TaxID=3455608 RepID=UPI003F8D66E0
MSDPHDRYFNDYPEQHIREELARMHREYQQLCAPLIRALVRLESFKPYRRYVINADFSHLEQRVITYMHDQQVKL